MPRLGLGLALFLGLCAGCESDGQSSKRARKPDIRVVRDVPSVLRSTIGAQASVRGLEPTLVSGYGLIVGLNGTGSGDVPGPVRAVMEREMTRLGVGREVGAFQGMTPDELLNSRDTAVVIVSAVVPIGAPVGTRFDVQVETLPGSATTSLEGGRLYTTDLFPGIIRPAAPATVPIAKASGQVFINPFADPGAIGRDSVRRNVGRVLNGGVVSQPRSVMLMLDAPSHSRARAITEAINSRFPRDRGEPPTAKGINEEIIEINIPAEFRDDPADFIELLTYTRVDQAFPQEAALLYTRALKELPEYSEALSRCLEALGPAALPHLRGMYDYAEVRPRMAAVLAGARLGDLTVAPQLEELATTGPLGLRPKAIALLGRLGQDPKINLFLRDLLNDQNLDVRIAAYEALERRRDPWIERRTIGDKFVVDTIPSVEPMIYVAMQRMPKIVLFGNALEVRRPVFASAWDGRLMLSNEMSAGNIRVYYRDLRTSQGVTGETPPPVLDLVEYLAHTTTPEEPAPGLDLTYSEVVGALSQIVKAGAIGASFVPETDRLALDLLRTRQTQMGEERPELIPAGVSQTAPFEGPVQEAETEFEQTSPESAASFDGAPPADPPGDAPPKPKRRYVIPLGPTPAQQGSSSGQSGSGSSRDD
jgi:flagellar basal body P-ring protein FlgI